jgi:hypothetical protein
VSQRNKPIETEDARDGRQLHEEDRPIEKHERENGERNQTSRHRQEIAASWHVRPQMDIRAENDEHIEDR